jgi:arylsulfatase A-like enzyme
MLDTAHLREALAPHAAAIRDLKRRLGVNSRRVKRLVQWPPDMREHPAGETGYPELLAELSPTLAQLQHTLPFNKTIAGMLTGVRDVEYPRALYAGEVSYADAELGRLVTTLESWGLRDRLVVAVTADHGEGMGEHDIYFAHTGLWEEMIRVPLVFWVPGRLPPAVRNDFASGLDVAPTLLGLVGLPAGATMEGRNLATAPAADAVVSESILGSQVALRTGDWKLVRTLRDYYSTTKFHREAGTVELYDLAHDPRETANLAAADPGRTAALSAQIDAWLATHGVRADAPAPPSVPERDRDRLRALGYVE